MELLVQPGISAAMLNDDTLGRALDALYVAGVTELFARVAVAGRRHYGIRYQFVHLDSSSFHLHGVYDAAEPEREAVRITYGYSKEERPDLKQVVVNLMISYRSAIRAWLRVLSGDSMAAQAASSSRRTPSRHSRNLAAEQSLNLAEAVAIRNV